MKKLAIALVILLVMVYLISIAASLGLGTHESVETFSDTEYDELLPSEAAGDFTESLGKDSSESPIIPTIEPIPTPTPATTSSPPEPTLTPTPESDPITQTITIAIGGDVLPEGNNGQIGKLVREKKFEEVVDSVTAERFRSSDISIINLESSVSVRGEPLDKAYTFRSAPETLSLLTDWLGVDAVSVANNHIVDYGWDAFNDTLTYLSEAGIGYAGAGANLNEAAEPFVFNVRGVTAAIFAANQIMTFTDWRAGEKNQGMLIARDPANLGVLADKIKDAADTYDYVLVYMHWGIEKETSPDDFQIKMSKALIDAGADVVFGAHPHVVQTFDMYNGKPIIYSLGNFVFNSNNPDTCAVYLTLQDGEITAEISPLKIKDTLTYIPDEKTAASMLKTWDDRSKNITIIDGVIRPNIVTPSDE